MIDRPCLEALALEIDGALRGCRVRRVHQPDPATLVLHLRGPREERRLLACADPAEARVHLAREVPPNPKTPFPFCMLARKHLKGRPFEEATPDPVLPVIVLRFGPLPPAGGEAVASAHVSLVVEWTGHASTVALLVSREGAPRVLGLLRPLPRARRDLSAGATWSPPVRPGRLDPRTAAAADLEAAVARVSSRSGSQGADRILSRAFEGVGRRLAAEALRRAGIDPQGPPSAIAGDAAARCLAALGEILSEPCAPHAVLDADGAPVDILPGAFPGPRARPLSTISEGLEEIHARRGSAGRLEARAAEVTRLLRKQIAHCGTKLARQREDLEEARRGDRRRVLADLLLAQGKPQRRGEASIEVTDLHDPSLPRVTIPLDPALSLAENAARLYQRARKSARAVGLLSHITARGQTEIGLLEDALARVPAATEIAALDEIARWAQEVLDARPSRSPAKRGPAKSERRSPAKRGPAKSERRSSRKREAGRSNERSTPQALAGGPHRYVVDGWEILAGRHSRDNDRIVSALGRPDDMWFHARDLPGAHVLLRNPARAEPPGAILEAAARIAAHHSPARAEAAVDVIVAPLRHVHKRKGLAAGQVEVTRGRTLRVKPGLPGQGGEKTPGDPGVPPSQW